MEKEIINKLINLYDKLDDIGWDLSEARQDLEELEINLKDKGENIIKDVENFKRELKRDGLYSEKLADFLEYYMKYYNK